MQADLGDGLGSHAWQVAFHCIVSSCGGNGVGGKRIERGLFYKNTN